MASNQLVLFGSRGKELEKSEQQKRTTTQRLINYVLRKLDTKIFFIVGLMRSGKSSFFEALTGSTGHARDGIDSVTQEYHLGHATIGGEFYVFVDTPGFDDSRTTDEAVFRNIVECIQTVQSSVTFAGILYVHPMGSIFSAGNSRFINWLEAFCGLPYSPYLTFVTTKWDVFHPLQLQKEINGLEIWKQKWSKFLRHGANMYHHGKCYDDNGIETGEILQLNVDKGNRSSQAKRMISRYYGKDEFPDPQFVEELKRGIPIQDTAAAKSLLRHPTHDGGANACATNSATNKTTVDVDWLKMFMECLLWPFRKLWEFVQWLFSYLPRGFTWTPILTAGALEIVITMPYGSRIVVGLGPHGIYVRSASEGLDEGGDFGPEDFRLEEFECAFNGEQGDEDVLSRLENTPEVQQFREAFRQAWNAWTGRNSGGWCSVM